jgi:hypothetical protein
MDAISFLLPLREKVACKAGRMRGLAEQTAQSFNQYHNLKSRFAPPLIRHAAHDTFSRKGRRMMLALAFLLTPTLAHACSCMRVSPDGFRQQAAVIVEGKVMSVKREGDINGRVIARIAVSKLVKGQAPRTVTVSTRGNSAACGVEFTKGQRGEFLLARQNGRLSTNICLMLGARR